MLIEALMFTGTNIAIIQQFSPLNWKFLERKTVKMINTN